MTRGKFYVMQMSEVQKSGKLIQILIVTLTLLTAQLSGAAPVLANDPGLQSSIDPNRTEKQIDEKRQQVNRSQKQTVHGLPQAKDLTNGGNTTSLFVLTELKISGATVFSNPELAGTYSNFLGKSVSEADLVTITNNITKLYRDQNYILSRAILPPQDITGGRISIKVIEGFIEKVIFDGEEANGFGLQKLMKPILAERPLKLSTMERHLMLINDTSGIRVTDSTLDEIGEGSGRFSLTISIDSWHTWSWLQLDNRGTNDVGPLQTYSSFALNSYFSKGETIGIDLSTIPDNPQASQFGRFSVDLPVGHNGSRIGFLASVGEIKPDGYRGDIYTRIETSKVTVKGSIVPHRTRKSSLWLTLSADAYNSIEENSSGTVYKDRVRALGLLADARFNDDFGGSNFLTVNLRQGFYVLGASNKSDTLLSRKDGDAQFFKTHMAFSRYQKLSDAWSLRLSGTGQLASKALLSSEEFYLGGSLFGRAFDGGDLSGDSGIAGLAELRYDHKLDTAPLKGYQLYSFIDGGTVWNRNVAGKGSTSLASYGFGARLHLDRGFEANFEIAKPSKNYEWSGRDNNARFFFSLSNSFKF